MSATLDPLADLSDVPFEVVDGNYVEKPMSIKSSWVAYWLVTHLNEWLSGRGLGVAAIESMFVFSPRLKRRPDVAFVSSDRWPLDREIPDEGDWEVVPDLAVEVASPKDTAEALHAKVVEYFDHSVRQVWVVLPKLRQVYLYDAPKTVRIVAAPDDLESSLLPGWRMPLSAIFRTTVAG